jgi:RNA polymerase sigma-70 factor (ECF subfamily)
MNAEFVDSTRSSVQLIDTMGQCMGDDAELVRRWQAGDPAAFERLVRRWERPLARFLARMLGPAGPVADLCQEVFLRVYLHRARYRAEGCFSTWLYSIALNLARDSCRRLARQPSPLPEGDGPLANGTPADTAWEQRELGEAVDLALDRLPIPLREVLVLRHYQGLSFEDMARLLGTPASTLKSRFAVALRRMQQLLTAMGWGEEELSR